MQRFGGLINLKVVFHLLVSDAVFVDDEDGRAFSLHPVPTSYDVVAIGASASLSVPKPRSTVAFAVGVLSGFGA